MRNHVARLGLLVALAGAVVWIRTDARAATCYGDDNCRACKNCRYCQHCAKLGGTCGVCKKLHQKADQRRPLGRTVPAGQHRPPGA